MVDHLQLLFLGSYFLVLLLLCLYGVHRYQLVALYYRHRRNRQETLAPLSEYPLVTVQLPIYNEKYVVVRLLTAVAGLDYPRDRLQIQVLDDSTDATTAMVGELVEQLRDQGFAIEHLHRAERIGYKAGALQAGLATARGEFIAIFDADFVPPPRFLLDTLPHFADGAVGMVQVRWGYLNRRYSLLTRLQAVYLDSHFVIEHQARNRSGRFFNFNGTAGLWRKASMIAAGGWQHDTLTEDLDISYRAQLQGWRFVYLNDTVAPSELPVQMTAFKGQQYRWAKGSIQTAQKLLWPILTSRQPLRVKVEAFFHMTNNVAYLLMVFLALSIYPSMVVRFNLGWWESFWMDVPLLLFATASVTCYYLIGQHALHGRWGSCCHHIPLLMALGIGISLNNGKAVLSALLGRETEFRRTPKHGIVGDSGSWRHKSYAERLDLVLLGEGLMTLYFSFNLYFALTSGIYVAVPFLLLFLAGFGYVFLLSLCQAGSRASVRWIPQLQSG